MDRELLNLFNFGDEKYALTGPHELGEIEKYLFIFAELYQKNLFQTEPIWFQEKTSVVRYFIGGHWKDKFGNKTPIVSIMGIEILHDVHLLDCKFNAFVGVAHENNLSVSPFIKELILGQPCARLTTKQIDSFYVCHEWPLIESELFKVPHQKMIALDSTIGASDLNLVAGMVHRVLMKIGEINALAKEELSSVLSN